MPLANPDWQPAEQSVTETKVTDAYTGTEATILTLPGGATIARDAYGWSTVEFPDGTKTVVAPDGVNTTMTPDGSRITNYTDGSHSITGLNGTTTTYNGDYKITQQPNGTTTVEHSDGSPGWKITTLPNGSKIEEHADGTRITKNPAGVKTGTEISADGTKTVYKPDGTTTVTAPPPPPPAPPTQAEIEQQKAAERQAIEDEKARKAARLEEIKRNAEKAQAEHDAREQAKQQKQEEERAKKAERLEEIKRRAAEAQAESDAREQGKQQGKVAQGSDRDVGAKILWKTVKKTGIETTAQVLKKTGLPNGLPILEQKGELISGKSISGGKKLFDGYEVVSNIKALGEGMQKSVDAIPALQNEIRDNIDKYSDPNWKPTNDETLKSGSVSYKESIKAVKPTLEGAKPFIAPSSWMPTSLSYK